ncbi:MAG TPA: glycoside hydrolase family 16 protein [Polyangiaceae bacterium]|nr:glycoside hydrolase family 16 protein [Polyangiaceae bacterium]
MASLSHWVASSCVALLALGCGGSNSEQPEGASGGSGGGTGSNSFTLLYRDDFDSLDQNRWQLMTHSWSSNLAVFSPQTATIENGALVVRLLPAPEGTMSEGVPKQFLGAEVRSRDTLTYGRVKARIKFASGSAVISSLVTIYTPWPADNWNELDIECLGAPPGTVQYNSQVYTGPPTTPPVTTPVSPTPDVFLETLGFDPTADFHEYAVEWTPESAKYLVDGEVRLTWTRNIALMNLPQNVLLTIWASSASSWAGPVTDATSQAAATYDWVELYRYTP